MPKSKSPRKNKKYRPTTGRIPVGLMHKLEVPESRIQALKQKHDAALLRMYMGSDDWQDRCELYSVLRFGESRAVFGEPEIYPDVPFDIADVLIVLDIDHDAVTSKCAISGNHAQDVMRWHSVTLHSTSYSAQS